MELTTDICELCGFKITETRCFAEGKLIKTFFNIRKIDGEIVSRDYENLNEPLDLLTDLTNVII